MTNRECMWVEFDEAGDTKKCVFSDYYEEIRAAHQVLKTFERDKIFHEIYCKYCLEGEKIEVVNSIRSVLNSIGGGKYTGEERVIKQLIEKYIQGE